MEFGKVDHHLGLTFEITDNPILFQSKHIATSNKKFTYFKICHGNFVDTFAISRIAFNKISNVFNQTHRNQQSDPHILRKGVYISIVQFLLSFAYPEPFEHTRIDKETAGQTYLSKIKFVYLFFYVFYVCVGFCVYF